MKFTLKISLAASALFTLAACATANAPAELMNARAAYSAAAVDAERAAPTDLHVARLALDDAEASFAKEPHSLDVKDLSYIAQRKSELAQSRAAVFTSHEQRDAANVKLRALGAEAATELQETREDLSAAQSAARSSASREIGLKGDLKVSQSKAEGLTSELADEKVARHDAESKLTATLQSMRDLQSVKEEPRGLVITLSGAVLFASGQWTLLPAAQSALNNVAEALKATPNRAISVEGYTDSQGTQQSNMDLSQRRGDAVRVYLLSRGIPDANIHATGFGPDRPVGDNATTEGRANNRRVEIVVAPAREQR